MFDRCSHLYRKKLAQSFIFTFRYIDIRSLHNSKFGDFVDRIYPIELEIKDTIDTARSVSYIDLHLTNDSEGRLTTKKMIFNELSIYM